MPGRLTLALALALVGASGAGAGTAPAAFEFGRLGGNIAPFTVAIGRDGDVNATGAVRPAKQHVAKSALATLMRVVETERFFALPRSIRCAGTLPDVASNTVTVRTATRARTVNVHGGCSSRFERVYAALAESVGVR